MGFSWWGKGEAYPDSHPPTPEGCHTAPLCGTPLFMEASLLMGKEAAVTHVGGGKG